MLERLLVEGEQHLSLLDLLAFLHRDIGHDARHVGRDRELAGMDIGVVGRHVAAARHEGEQRARQHDGRARHQQQATDRPGLLQPGEGRDGDLVGEAEPPEEVPVSHGSLSFRRSPPSPW